MIHRYRRRRFRRGNNGFHGYTPVMYYSHRYRNSDVYMCTSGFISSLESKKDVCRVSTVDKGSQKECKTVSVKTYFNDTHEFKSFFPDLVAPISLTSAGAPYFQSVNELKCLLNRYEKYKLVSVKHYLKNFKFLQITIRVKDSSVTKDEMLKVQQYFIKRYGGGGDMELNKEYVVPYDKFEIFYQYVPSITIEKVYRNHTVITDSVMDIKDVDYGVGDAPIKYKTLYNKSVMRESYYPKCKNYLPTKDFFLNKYDNGNFKKWLDAFGVTNYPNYTYGRISLGPDQYMDGDINTAYFNVMFFDAITYYRFKFAGINNLNVQ